MKVHELLTDNILESGLSRIHAGISAHAAGAITAFRSEFTKDENRARNRDLLALLLNKKYSVTSVKGSYIEDFNDPDPLKHNEVGEESLFVINRAVKGDDGGELENDLISLGKKFDQDSILSIRNQEGVLIGTSKRENAYPGFGEKKAPAALPNFAEPVLICSRIKGRQFAFETVDFIKEIEYPGTINGIRGLQLHVKNLL